MSCESYDLRLTTLSPIHIGSGKSYNCCEFVPAKAKSKGQIVKIIKRVNLTNYYSSLSDDRKDTFLASLTNSNFELKQFDKKIKKDFVRYQCIDNSRVDFINEVQEHIKTSDKLYIPGSSIKGAIRTAIFYNLLTEEDMDKIGRDISSNRRNNSFLSNDLLKKHFTSGFGNDAQYNIFRFMQVADTTTTNLPRIEQVLAVMATDDRRKNQFYSRHGKVVKSYLETIGANKNLEEQIETIYNSFFVYYDDFSKEELEECEIGLIPKDWELMSLGEVTTKIKEKVGSDDYKVFSAVNTGNLILSEEYFDKQVYSKNIEKYIVVKQKEFAYNPARINIGSIGRNDFNYDGCVSPVYVAFKVEEGYENFMNMYIKSNRFNQWVVTLSSGSVRQTLNYADFSIIKIAYPPKDLVNKFNKVYDNYYEVINYNNSVISNLENIRDTLLPKLMSGEIDVSKINCDLELKYNYMKYLFNQIHTPMSKSVV